MHRAPSAILAIVAAVGCGGDVVAPPPAVVRQTDASPSARLATAVPNAPAAMRAPVVSETAGLDDALARLVPALGPSAAALKGPLSLLRDDVSSANSAARSALLAAAVGAVDRLQARASDDQQADLAAILLVLDAVRADDAERDTGK